MSSEGFLEAAASLGRRIAADAVWHDGRCSWMGAAVESDDRSRPEWRALGPLVYDGTAGVGLFLAHLYAATGERALHRTAAGALRHAVERAARLPPGQRDGLHAGTLGIALAAARCGAVLDADDLVAGARVTLERCRPPAAPRRCPDLVMGAAGTAVALLGLMDALQDPELLEPARATGEALLESASVTPRGWSWRDPARPRPHHLCGAAHGASGIGWALLELLAATGDARFEAAATGAFAYERSWLDGETRTWPDLRLKTSRAARATRMTATWCYGEAGIALSRLRAGEVLGDGPHRADAGIAVETTRRHLEERLPFAFDDLSLCHGAAGAGDALLTAAHAEAALALGRTALERHGERGDWPCGAHASTPGLFRGLSGIGWFFLRLHDPAVASPLAIPRVG